MGSYHSFYNSYPLQKTVVNGEVFPYRHHKHERSQVTLVLLVGGLGLSDLIFTHFEKFAKDFSVITFDYAPCYENNEKLAAAIHSLLVTLDTKAWLVGQSLGGFIAQLVAERYPDVCEGLILSNTGCTSASMSDAAYDSLIKMLDSTKKNKRLLKSAPFSFFKKQIRKKILKKYGANFSKEERHMLQNLCDIMEKELSKEYGLHMMNLLIDMQNHFGAKKENFEYLNDRVLLILSQDDTTFHAEVKSALIDLMPSPTVQTDIKGGHLSLLVNSDAYIKAITNYIQR